MLMTMFEYLSLFGSRDPATVSEEEVQKKRQERDSAKESSKDFYTWKEAGIVIDEYGEPSIAMVERTGFENEGA